MATIRTLHHLGREFVLRDDPQAEAGARVRALRRPAPGSGDITVDALTVSPAVDPAGAPLSLTARVSGRLIASIFIEAWLVDGAGEVAFGPLHRQHLAAERTREVGGVRLPAWDGTVAVAAEFRPAWPLLVSGDAAALVAPEPARYGSSDREVRGVHTSAASGQARDARLNIDELGAVRHLALRPRTGGPRAFRSAVFAIGDTFAPSLRVLIPGADGRWTEGRCLTDDLVFAGETFRLEAVAPAPGRYLAGLAVQDLDGGIHRTLAEFRVDGA